MATDFNTLTAIRDTISTFATRDQNDLMQQFGLRRDMVSTLSALKSFRTMSPIDREKLQNTVETQSHVIQGIYSKGANGTKTGRNRIGAGNLDISNVTPNFQTRIRQEFDDSFVHHVQRQVLPQDLADKGSRARLGMQQHFEMQLMEMVIKPAYERLNDQFIAYLEANKWGLTTLADSGTIYTTYTGDAKNIPATDAPLGSTTTYPLFLSNIETEAKQNNFLNFGRPVLIASTATRRHFQEYMRRGEGQNVDVIGEIGSFDIVLENRIAEAVGDTGTFYMIARNGVECYQRSPFPYHEYQDVADSNGMVVIGSDVYMPPFSVGEGTGILPELPRIDFEWNVYRAGGVDNSGTFGDEGKIDITTAHVMTAQMGFQKAVDFENAAISPIIKHVIKA